MMFPWVLEHSLVCFLHEDFELKVYLRLTPSLLHLKLKVKYFTISHSGQRSPIPLPLYLLPFLTSHLSKFSSSPNKIFYILKTLIKKAALTLVNTILKPLLLNRDSNQGKRYNFRVSQMELTGGAANLGKMTENCMKLENQHFELKQ